MLLSKFADERRLVVLTLGGQLDKVLPIRALSWAIIGIADNVFNLIEVNNTRILIV